MVSERVGIVVVESFGEEGSRRLEFTGIVVFYRSRDVFFSRIGGKIENGCVGS